MSKPSHDTKKVRTRSYRFSGYQLKRVITDRNNNIVDALPKTTETPYGALKGIATSTTAPLTNSTIQAGNINDQT